MMGDFALKVIRKLLKPVYRRIDYIIATISLESCADVIEDLKKDFKCRAIEKADLSEIGTEFGDTTRRKFEDRMERGEQGYLVWDTKGNMTGYVWAAHQTVKNEGVPPFVFDIVPNNGHIYWYDGFTAPGRRNSGGMTALLAFLLQQSAADGFKMAFYLIDGRNHPIRKVALKLGFQIDGEIKYRRYFTYVKKDMKALL